MLYFVMAVLSSSAISLVMRLSTDKAVSRFSMLAVNYIVCTLLGIGYTAVSWTTQEFAEASKTMGLGAINGVLLLSSFVLLQYNTRKNGIVLSSLFMKLGLLVPMVMSVVVFHETPAATQIAGFCIAVGAIVLINLKGKEQVKRIGAGLLLLLLLGGSADAMAKVYEAIGSVQLSDLFLAVSFAASFVLCLGLVVFKKEKFDRKSFLYGILIGIPNFFCSKFLLGALRSLAAVVVYPTFCVATILIVTLCGVLLFRERLTRRQWIALAAIVAALVLLNI